MEVPGHVPARAAVDVLLQGGAPGLLQDEGGALAQDLDHAQAAPLDVRLAAEQVAKALQQGIARISIAIFDHEVSMQWELLDREVLYQGFFRLERYHLRHQRFAGGWTDILRREIFERGHAVAVLPYDPRRDAVVMIEQFRPGALEAPGGPWLWEFPAGMIEPGESIEAVARREMREEAGLIPLRLESIGRFWVSPGGTTESLYLYYAEVDSSGAGGLHGLPHEHEDIRVSVLPREEAMAMLEQGLICSAAPMVLLQWLALHLSRLRGASS